MRASIHRLQEDEKILKVVVAIVVEVEAFATAQQTTAGTAQADFTCWPIPFGLIPTSPIRLVGLSLCIGRRAVAQFRGE